MNLPEEVLLCAIDDKGNIASSHKIAAAVGGATLAELALAGRIRLDGDTIVVADPTPTGEPLADELLASLQQPDATKLAAPTLIPTFGVQLFPRVHDGIVAAGAVRMHQGKRSVIGLRKPETREITPAGEEPRGRVRAALLGGSQADARTAAVAAIITASGHHKVLVSGDERRVAEQRAGAFAAGDGIPAAVVDAIEATRTAVVNLGR